MKKRDSSDVLAERLFENDLKAQLAAFQSQADAAFTIIGQQAPQRPLGGSAIKHVATCADQFLTHIAPLPNLPTVWRCFDAATLTHGNNPSLKGAISFASMIFKAGTAAFTAPVGPLRSVVYTDPGTGRKERHFYGDIEEAFRPFQAPVRRAEFGPDAWGALRGANSPAARAAPKPVAMLMSDGSKRGI